MVATTNSNSMQCTHGCLYLPVDIYYIYTTYLVQSIRRARAMPHGRRPGARVLRPFLTGPGTTAGAAPKSPRAGLG